MVASKSLLPLQLLTFLREPRNFHAKTNIQNISPRTTDIPTLTPLFPTPTITLQSQPQLFLRLWRALPRSSTVLCSLPLALHVNSTQSIPSTRRITKVISGASSNSGNTYQSLAIRGGNLEAAIVRVFLKQPRISKPKDCSRGRHLHRHLSPPGSRPRPHLPLLLLTVRRTHLMAVLLGYL